jgi:phosphoribosylformylglycinamidine cyclo-ligase
VLPEGVGARIDSGSWEWPALFRWLQRAGNVETAEMYRTFNCGVGMVLCVAPEAVDETLSIIAGAGFAGWRLGVLETGSGVTIEE